MAIPDGKPATDFSAMNREWVRSVAKESGSLPEVSGSDNGKVMTVVSGEWEAATPAASGIPAPADPSDGDVLTYSSTDSAWVAAAPSGGGSVMLITNNNGTLNKTGQEIANAFTGGTTCIIVTQQTVDVYNDTKYSPIVFYFSSLSESEGNYYSFTVLEWGEGDTVGTNYTCTDLSDYPVAQV